MGPQPTGTVTFLFTDIQGSTKLWQTVPEAMRRSHARHNELLREAIESQGGYIFQVIGDAFCSAFHSAEQACQAAVQSQCALQAEPWGEAAIRVRMGVHTGRADLRDDGQYSGYLALSRVQRIMSAAYGGQALLSSTTERLLRESAVEVASLRDLGEHRLKDLPQAEHLFQLVIPGLPEDFPPLRTLDAFPNNLPLQLTSFIGREKELEDVNRLLADTRLLTLIGPGGTGKTRLSLQAAADLLHTFPQGAWLVELAPVTDPAGVPGAVLAALGLPAEVHRPAIDMLCDHLRERETLLILDNCEHLVEACARMVDQLLHAAPGLRVLVSSRESLGIAGEVSYRVPSLGLPDLDRMPQVKSLDQYEAVRLFIERARAARADFNVTNENAPAVAQICHRLDGIPLAIELAAAKVRALSVEQIAKRLDDRFRLLTGGSRTALERHQTLRAALDWSYNFLPPAEQVLFERLAIFVGGWTLEAAEAVCAGEGVMGEEVFGLLEQLVNKSLVSSDMGEGETRYSMLETMRQYGREKLDDAGESTALRDRHLAYFLELAEQAAPHLLRREQVEWLDRLEADHDNLRAALEWSLGKEPPGQALGLAGALGTFWDIHSHWKEGARWLERALSLPHEGTGFQEDARRVRALYQDARLAEKLDHLERMRASAEAALDLWQPGMDPLDRAIARFYLGFALYRVGEYEPAGRLLEENLADPQLLKDPYWKMACQFWLADSQVISGKQNFQMSPAEYLEQARSAGERQKLGMALLISAEHAWDNERLAAAQAYLEEAEQVFREAGYTYPVAGYYGVIAHGSKDFQRARKLYQDAIAAHELMGDKWTKSQVFQMMARLSRDEGKLSEAQSYAEGALATARQMGNSGWAMTRVVLLGQIYALQGKTEEAKMHFKESLGLAKRGEVSMLKAQALILLCTYLAGRASSPAAQLLAAVQAEDARQTMWRVVSPLYRGDYDDALARARLELGESAFEVAWKAGQGMDMDEACALALKVLEDL